MEQRLVAGVATQHGGDVGDEEGTPHDEEEEEDDSQDLSGENAFYRSFEGALLQKAILCLTIGCSVIILHLFRSRRAGLSDDKKKFCICSTDTTLLAMFCVVMAPPDLFIAYLEVTKLK